MTLRWTSYNAFFFIMLLSLWLRGVVGDMSSDSSSAATPPRDLQTTSTCPTSICPSGSNMTSGDSYLPIFPDGPKTCTQTDALLAAQDATACAIVINFEKFLSLEAYCGCSGSSPPALCTTCSGGGQVTQPDNEFNVPLFNITFSCRQAANFVSFLTSDIACSGFTTLFDQACCSSSSSGTPTAPTAGGGGTTSAPAAAPTMATPSPSVSAPSSVTVPTAPTAGMPTAGSASPYPSASAVPTQGSPSSTTAQPSISSMPASAPTTPTSPTAPSAPTSTSMAVSITGSYVGAMAVMLTIVVASHLYVG